MLVTNPISLQYYKPTAANDGQHTMRTLLQQPTKEGLAYQPTSSM
jgi:hypothetical protein